MSSKHPFLLPMAAVVILVLLYMFKNQQLDKASTLRQQARTAKPILVAHISDPLEGKPKGEPVACLSDKAVYGYSYAFTSNISAGSIAFDLLGFNQSLTDEMLFFAVTGSRDEACMPSLLNTSVISLAFNTKTDSLRLTVNQKAVSWRLNSQLPLPIHFLVEWYNGKATLFVNGGDSARVAYPDSLPVRENRLLLGQSTSGKDKIGADFKALKVLLLP